MSFDTYPGHPDITILTPAYADLVAEVNGGLVPNHSITYVPLEEPAPLTAGKENMQYASRADLPEVLDGADTIICISRDEVRSTSYDNAHPDHNIELFSSAVSNVDTSVALFHDQAARGQTPELIVTGRMHNRGIDMMVALPAICDFIGVNHEDAYYISEQAFGRLLARALGGIDSDEALGLARAWGFPVEPEGPSGSDHRAVYDEITKQFAAYPRISTSRLMLERATAAGVPLENIYEEDNAVDTITNLLFSLERLVQTGARKVVIVAGSDQLPRTMWIADHILPDGIEIVCVESDPALGQEAYDASCERERQSFLKGSRWIGGSRDPEVIQSVVDAGYYGPSRVNAARLAAFVASSSAAVTPSSEE